MGKREYNRLTAAFVRTVTKPGQYWDGHGLILRVTGTGSKQWVQRMRIHGKRHEFGLGGYPLVSLAAAREAALTHRREAQTGDDLLGRRRRERAAAVTFEAMSRELFELKRPHWTNAKHAGQWLGTLEEFVFPRLANRAVADVDANDVLEVLKPLLTRTPTTAKRVRQRIAAVLSHAQAKGLRLDNPAEAVGKSLRQKNSSPQAHHRALPYAQVADAIASVRASKVAPALRLSFEFLVLTAARAGEVRFLPWSEIDIASRIWTIPAERMKSRRLHQVPLCDRAMEILGEAKALKSPNSDLVFPTRRGRPTTERGFVQMLTRLGIDATAHGFRSSFRIWTQERTNVPREICEAALAHSLKDKAEAAYARSDLLEKRRELMVAWGRYLNPEPAAVVSLESRRAAG